MPVGPDPAGYSRGMTGLHATLLLEYMSDAVLMLDEQLVVRELNDKVCLLYRREPDRICGHCLTDIFPELEATGAIGQLHAARTGRIPRRLEIFIPSLFSWHAILAVPVPGGMALFVRDIGDRVRRESEEAAQSAVRKVVESMPLCVTITMGPQHRIVQANHMARSLVGNREVEGELLERVLPEARDQGFIGLLDGVFASGKAHRGEEIALRWKPDASTAEKLAYFDLVYQPLLGKTGRVEGVLHLGTEVTEKVERRRLVEQYALERQAVLEQLDEGVILTDGEGRITFVNQAAEAMHGVKLLGVGPGDYSDAYSLLTDDETPHPSDMLPLSRAVREHVVVRGAIWKIRRADATILRVRGNAKPIFSEGRLVACVLTLAPA